MSLDAKEQANLTQLLYFILRTREVIGNLRKTHMHEVVVYEAKGSGEHRVYTEIPISLIRAVFPQYQTGRFRETE